ncbi:MAG: response regulator [Verrucomicrobiota bacterium]
MTEHLSAKRIVVVEDDGLTSQSLRDYFKDHNAVLTYPSAEALLERPQDLNQIDLFIIDYRLPGMDGVELFEKLKLENANARFICISGEISMDLASRINEIGFDALILKPFDFAILEQNIASLTEA